MVQDSMGSTIRRGTQLPQHPALTPVRPIVLSMLEFLQEDSSEEVVIKLKFTHVDKKININIESEGLDDDLNRIGLLLDYAIEKILEQP